MAKKTKHARFLKVWDSAGWRQALSKTITVSRGDEWIHVADAEQTARKPWLVALTQTQRRAVRGLPRGTTVVLWEDEAMALVDYLFESGLLGVSDDGRIVNAEAAEDAWVRAASAKRRRKKTKRSKNTKRSP